MSEDSPAFIACTTASKLATRISQNFCCSAVGGLKLYTLRTSTQYPEGPPHSRSITMMSSFSITPRVPGPKHSKGARPMSAIPSMQPS